MYIRWRRNLETGQPLIDAEHRMLVFIFRKMDVAIKTRVPLALLNGIIAEVRQYVRFHFISEENLMKETGYPLLEQHQAQHAELISRLDSFSARVLANREFPEDMLSFLSDWLSEHIAKHDRDVALYLRGAGDRPIAEFEYPEYLSTGGDVAVSRDPD